MAKTLPNDKTVESGIVGSLLRKPELVLSAEYVKQSMFYDDTLGILYKCIFDIYDEGITEVDDIAIITKLNESPRYKRLLQDKNITDLRILFDNLRLVGTLNQEEYERRCRRLATLDFKRKTYLTLTDISELVVSDKDESDINELNLKIQDSVMGLSESYLLTNDVQLIGAQLSEIRKTINLKNIKGQGAGLPSKFPILKEYFSYEPGELIIVGGRAKFWLAIQKCIGNNRAISVKALKC